MGGMLLIGKSWSGPVAGSLAYSYDRDYRLRASSVNGAFTTTGSTTPTACCRSLARLPRLRSGQRPVHARRAGRRDGDAGLQRLRGAAQRFGHFNAAPLFAQQFGRDPLGRVASLTETVSGVTHVSGYRYDRAGRLIAVTQDGALVAYGYDANGNRTSIRPAGSDPSAYDAQDRLTAYGADTFGTTPRRCVDAHQRRADDELRLNAFG